MRPYFIVPDPVLSEEKIDKLFGCVFQPLFHVPASIDSATQITLRTLLLMVSSLILLARSRSCLPQ